MMKNETEKYVLLKFFKKGYFSKCVILKCKDYPRCDFTKTSKSGKSKKFPDIKFDESDSVYVGYRMNNVTGK